MRRHGRFLKTCAALTPKHCLRRSRSFTRSRIHGLRPLVACRQTPPGQQSAVRSNRAAATPKNVAEAKHHNSLPQAKDTSTHVGFRTPHVREGTIAGDNYSGRCDPSLSRMNGLKEHLADRHVVPFNQRRFRNLVFRRATHRANALGRKMTGDELARPELTHERLLVCAPSPGKRTARVKTAAGRWRIR